MAASHPSSQGDLSSSGRRRGGVAIIQKRPGDAPRPQRGRAVNGDVCHGRATSVDAACRRRERRWRLSRTGGCCRGCGGSADDPRTTSATTGPSRRPGEDVVGFGSRGGATAARGERPVGIRCCWFKAMVMDSAPLTLKSLQFRGQKTRAFSNKKTLSIGKFLETPRMNARENYVGVGVSRDYIVPTVDIARLGLCC